MSDKPLRVVVWSTGTIGRHAIAGIDSHPAMELVGVWVSNPEKEGKDAGVLAGLDHELGVLATTTRPRSSPWSPTRSCTPRWPTTGSSSASRT